MGLIMKTKWLCCLLLLVGCGKIDNNAPPLEQEPKKRPIPIAQVPSTTDTTDIAKGAEIHKWEDLGEPPLAIDFTVSGDGNNLYAFEFNDNGEEQIRYRSRLGPNSWKTIKLLGKPSTAANNADLKAEDNIAALLPLKSGVVVVVNKGKNIAKLFVVIGYEVKWGISVAQHNKNKSFPELPEKYRFDFIEAVQSGTGADLKEFIRFDTIDTSAEAAQPLPEGSPLKERVKSFFKKKKIVDVPAGAEANVITWILSFDDSNNVTMQKKTAFGAKVFSESTISSMPDFTAEARQIDLSSKDEMLNDESALPLDTFHADATTKKASGVKNAFGDDQFSIIQFLTRVYVRKKEPAPRP